MADTPGIPTPASLGVETQPTAEDVFNSINVSLADLCAKGTAQFAHKNYDEAADLFARASELQAELNGEMSPDNAEILFLYGRSLFKVGQGKSDVLGGRAGGEKKKPKHVVKATSEEGAVEEREDKEEKAAEEGVAIVTPKDSGAAKTNDELGAKKPLFQFTGDENFEDSDDEEGQGEVEVDDEEEDEDDLAVAFEVLDLARVLFLKKLETPESGTDDKGKDTGDSPMTKHIKERLADTHDLLAEISLENERFPGAVVDFRAALQLKKDLYAEESEIIAEAHFKLSLALEFASISRPKEEGDEDVPATESDAYLDQSLRDEAVAELEAAINSTKLKLQTKEVELASMHSPDDNDITRAQIAEVKEIVADMENRLVELKGPTLNMKAALYGSEAVGGVLGATLGETPSEATARIEEAKKGATDLTGLIKRKKSAKIDEPETSSSSTNGKRKANDSEREANEAKKVKFEEDSANGNLGQAD